MGILNFFRKSEQPQRRQPRLATRTYRAPQDKTVAGGWLPSSAYERAPSALSAIRGRARDLAHNNPHASRAVSVLTSHTVGSGIRFSMRGDDEYERAFRAWASSTACDYEGRLNLYGQQSVMARTMYEAGDAFAVIRQEREKGDDGVGRIVPKIQLVDPDQLDEGASPRGIGNKVLSGVEVNPRGQIVGYHMKVDLDGQRSEFFSADVVIHLFEQLYPGQVRGIPRGAQALVRANTIDSFMSAALAKARVEACLAAFITGPSLDDSTGIIGEADDVGEFVLPERLEPGTIVPLPDGHDLKVVVPSSSGGMREYIEVSLMSCAMAYGVTYAQLSGDVSKANYSSEKASRLEFYRGVDTVRAHFVMPALARVEAAFREAFVASEGREVDVTVSMTAPGRESIEPSKDALADMTALAAGGKSFGQYCAERGLDREEQLRELKEERRMIADAGVELQFGTFILALAAAAAAEDARAISTDSESG
ncbi:phage portal protein [Cereibacter azotoformans]|uniref:Lambda family phage portal protein n=1 Tax=Cereibacter azotoformans TaxID=43057 RepID=A0A2T5K791_9RHOB|nr:phage portal protein [Cereibacter azotoformans]MBO4169541.1 phage portal protein [Cereibacter azotoformans]PTR18218.1 lambda family phage portal protein [Cereibacter azotoformans]